MPTSPGKVRVSVDVTPEQRQAWREAAEREGVSLNRFVADALDAAVSGEPSQVHIEVLSVLPTGARRPRKIVCEHGVPVGVRCEICDR